MDSLDKNIVKQEIVDTINRICTGDHNTCEFGFCRFNFHCAKPHYVPEKLSDNKHRLKSTLKNVKKHERKKLGLPPPPPVHHPRKVKVTKPNGIKKRKSIKVPFSWERVKWILGEDIKEHYLIKGHETSLKKVERIDNWTDAIRMMQRRYKQVHKKDISLPNGRKLYWEYKSENHPDFIMPIKYKAPN